MSKIYTRQGDQGNSSLIGEVGLSKDELIFEVIGDIDELNASIGLVKCLIKEKLYIKKLEKVQEFLFKISSEIVHKNEIHNRYDQSSAYLLNDSDINNLEREIDEWDNNLIPLNNFLFPGSNQISAQLHFARSVCRRTERTIVKYGRKETLRPQILILMNRLSDWLFVLARTTSQEDNKIWKV
jgi:cob(I)alamin adenosyltransferase